MSFIYHDLYAENFKDDLKKYSSVKQQTEKKIDRILLNPYHNTEPLS